MPATTSCRKRRRSADDFESPFDGMSTDLNTAFIRGDENFEWDPFETEGKSAVSLFSMATYF